MSAPDKSIVKTAGDTLFTFFALYFTTLFSLDSWAAARASAFRAPGTNTYFRPANATPSADSYQARYSANGHRRGTDGGSDRRGVGRVPTARDSRAPLPLAVPSCGSCG